MASQGHNELNLWPSLLIKEVILGCSDDKVNIGQGDGLVPNKSLLVWHQAITLTNADLRRRKSNFVVGKLTTASSASPDYQAQVNGV